MLPLAGTDRLDHAAGQRTVDHATHRPQQQTGLRIGLVCPRQDMIHELSDVLAMTPQQQEATRDTGKSDNNQPLPREPTNHFCK